MSLFWQFGRYFIRAIGIGAVFIFFVMSRVSPAQAQSLAISPTASFQPTQAWTLNLSGAVAHAGESFTLCARQTRQTTGEAVDYGCSPQGTVPGSGSWSLSGTFSPTGPACDGGSQSCLGSWEEWIEFGGGGQSTRIFFSVNGSGTLNLVSANFAVGTSWTLTLSSTIPNSEVWICAVFNGFQDCNRGDVLPNPGQATTNGSGSWSTSGSFRAADIGSWQEWAELRSNGSLFWKSNTISFMVTAGCAGCLIGATCYASGVQNPFNACQVCDPPQSATNWSTKSGSHFTCQLNTCTSVPNTVSICTNQSGCSVAGAACGCAVNFNQLCNTNPNCNGRFACDGITCTGGANCSVLGQVCNSGVCASSCSPNQGNACDTNANCGGRLACNGTACTGGTDCTRSGQVCSNGSCASACTPEADAQFCARLGKNCGSWTGTDNCGNARTAATCGSCPAAPACVNGVCGGACIPDCTGRVCGNDVRCGQACPPGCGSGQTCDTAGRCINACVPDCANKQCGDDGCGGTCGPCTVSGQTCGGGGVPNQCGAAPAGESPSVPKILLGRASIPNLLSAGSIKEFLSILIDFLIFIGLIAAGLLIVYGGVRMMLSAGNATHLMAAKGILTWAIIGFVVLILAKVFILVITNFYGVGSGRSSGGGGGGGGGGATCVVAQCSAAVCQNAETCTQAGCTWTAGVCGPPVTPGSAPMLFVDMSISGDGSRSTVFAQTASFDGFYSAPVLDIGEYIAKLKDVTGQTLFVHGFNGANAVSGETLDATAGTLDLAKSGGSDIGTLNTAIILPALPGSVTLEITNAAGVPLTSQDVAAAVAAANRQFAARHARPYAWFTPDTVKAANGIWRIAVIGANYPTQAAFDADWRAFETHLRATDPYARLGAVIVIEPIYKNPPAQPTFTPADLRCSLGQYQGTCKGYYCPSVTLTAISAAQQSYDNVVAFIWGQGEGGCAEVERLGGNSRFVTVNSKGNAVLSGQIAVHEISHAFGSLLDEYLYGNVPQNFTDMLRDNNKNCEKNSGCPRWGSVAGAACIAGCTDSVHFRSLDESIMKDPYKANVFGSFNNALLERQFTRAGFSPSAVQDTEPPTIHIEEPKANAVLKGVRSLWVIANDTVGVSRVEFYANGGLLGLGTQQAAYDGKGFRYFWNTALVPDGVYRLSAIAYDAAQNKTTSPAITVTVANASACVPNCANKCGGPSGCPAPNNTCLNTCTAPQPICQANNTTCCVANRGLACNTNPCLTGMTIQCDGICGGGTVRSGTHLECRAGLWTAMPNSTAICANQPGAGAPGTPCTAATCSLAANGSAAAINICVGDTVTWALASNPAGLAAFWHGTKNNVGDVNNLAEGVTPNQLVITYTCADIGSYTRYLHMVQGATHAACTTNVISATVRDCTGACSASACTPESNAAFCARYGKNCGPVTGPDNCNQVRTVASCGACTAPATCGGGGSAGICGVAACVPETDVAFCARYGKNCDGFGATDNCGASRTASCGTCTAPQSCGGNGDANVCGSPASGLCGTLNGLDVICLSPGASYTVNGTVSYNAAGVAMGMGAPQLGYIPISYPFRCAALGGQNAAGVSNVADGKICEATFVDPAGQMLTGTATYTITADANAPQGEYPFGLSASAGATAQEAGFYIRIQ